MPPTGATLDVDQPGRRPGHRQGPGEFDAEDVDRAVNAAATAFETWKNTTPAGAHAAAPQARRRARGARRRARAARVEERRQAGRRRDRRDPGRRRQPALLRRRRAGDGRPGRQRVHGRPHLDHPARPGRRRRLDRAVELPALHGRLEARAGARGRQYGRPQAVGPDAADRAASWPRSPPTSCRPASSTSSPAPAPTIGDALVGHPKVRMVSVTGDTVTGKHIARTAAETGQAAPPRARWQGAGHRLRRRRHGAAVIETLKLFGYWNAGQDCTAACRVIAGPEDLRQFVAALADQVKTIKWGDPAEGDDIEMGSLIAQAQADKVEGMVDRARVGRRGRRRRDPPGPAGRLLRADRHRRAGPDSRRSSRTRSSGRSSRVQRFSDEEQAIAWANDVPLRAGVVGLHERHRAGRCGSPRRSSSGPSGSTSTSRSRRRRRTAAFKQSGYGKDGASTRSRTTRSSST